MFVRQTIEIRPNNKQKTYFRQCFGARCLAYNYGIQEWIRRRDKGDKTNIRDIRLQFNREKADGRWPFLNKVSSSATACAFDDLKKAFENFFKGHDKIKQGSKDDVNGFPQPKSKTYNTGSYTEYFSTNGSEGGPMITDHRVIAKDIKCKNGNHNTRFKDVPKSANANINRPYLRLPRLGTVRMMRSLRYKGRLVSVTIYQQNERFYACFMIEITKEEFLRVHPRYNITPQASVGIDLGIKDLAVTSDGIAIENPSFVQKQLQKENRQQERMNHCTGKLKKSSPSKNFLKAKMKLWRIRTKIRNQRMDLRNKFCACVLMAYQNICIETLCIKSMANSVDNKRKKKKLNQHLSDVSLYEIRHRLQTLGELLGRNVVLAPSNFTSTRRCSKCGYIKQSMDIKQRIYVCPNCGNEIDRDLNAAINLYQLTGRGTSCLMPQATDLMCSELTRSSIKHRSIGEGK